MWKLLLVGKCGSWTEPLEYIVSIYPISGINKEGMPLSQLPQQRRKGEEQSWWEEKWCEGRGALWGERSTLFACDCGQRKSMSYQGMCLESVFVCKHVWMSDVDAVDFGVSMLVCVCVSVCVWGAFSLGCEGSENVQRMPKQSWTFFPSYLFLWTLIEDWLDSFTHAVQLKSASG